MADKNKKNTQLKLPNCLYLFKVFELNKLVCYLFYVFKKTKYEKEELLCYWGFMWWTVFLISWQENQSRTQNVNYHNKYQEFKCTIFRFPNLDQTAVELMQEEPLTASVLHCIIMLVTLLM